MITFHECGYKITMDATMSQFSTLFKNVRLCEGLSVVLQHLKDPLYLFLKRNSCSEFLSRLDMTWSVESDVRPFLRFLPFIIRPSEQHDCYCCCPAPAVQLGLH